jgi:glycosyltransferase involved in cell wall biosynthesis
MTPRVSIVIPVYNEGNTVVPVIERIIEMVKLPCEILVVFDTEDDTTVPFLWELAEKYPQLRPLRNTYGRGPAFAIRYGIDASTAPVAVVTMSDGCDDPSQIDQLARLIDRGVVVAAASRYARSGQQVGGPMMKSLMSRIAGLSLYWFARVGTRDATNSFKAYSTSFVKKVGIESDRGFELGIELVAKARRYRQPVAEIPTIWLDRAFGESNFKLWAWISRYLHWYFYAFGPRKSLPK